MRDKPYDPLTTINTAWNLAHRLHAIEHLNHTIFFHASDEFPKLHDSNCLTLIFRYEWAQESPKFTIDGLPEVLPLPTPDESPYVFIINPADRHFFEELNAKEI